MKGTTIKIDISIKRELDKLKITPNETYNNIIKRLLENGIQS